MVVGSAILAFPVAVTEDAWHLGEGLPVINVMIIIALSLAFAALYG